MALDWRSAALACTADPAWRRRIFRGGLLLAIPFVGWPLALGYRRLFVEHLLDGSRPLLPDWHGNHGRALRHGLAAMGVIHGYFAPLYLWLALRTRELELWPLVPWAWVLLFFLAFPIFSTLIVPLWLGWLRWGVDVEGLHTELALLGVLFAATTFAIPAGFLRVFTDPAHRLGLRCRRQLAPDPRVATALHRGLDRIGRHVACRALLSAPRSLGGLLVLPRHHLLLQRSAAS